MDSDRTGTGRVGCWSIGLAFEWAESVHQEMTFFWRTGVEKHIKMNKKMTGAPHFDDFFVAPVILNPELVWDLKIELAVQFVQPFRGPGNKVCF